MNSQEMETALRENVSMVIMIWNDSEYGLIRQHQERRFGRYNHVSFANPDFVRYAESFGAMGYQVESAADATAVAGMYTSNKSYAYAVGQQNYWGGDKWRFSGALGRANLNLDLLATTKDDAKARARWLVDGRFLYADIARAVVGHWFVGLNVKLDSRDLPLNSYRGQLLEVQSLFQ